MANRLQFKREVDGILFQSEYNLFRHGVHLTVQRGTKRVKRFISFNEVPIVGVNQLIDMELQDMKKEVLKFPYEDVYPIR